MEETNQVQCQACGATIAVVPGVSTYVCEYCGSEVNLFQPTVAEIIPLEPEKIICFNVDKNKFHAFLLDKIVSDPFAPDDILESGTLEEEKLKFVPCYFFQGQFRAHWTASFGYDRQVRETVYVTRVEGNRRRSVPETHYRTVTDWRPASGVAAGVALVHAYAGPPLPTQIQDMLNAIPSDASVRYAKGYAAGFSLDPFALKQAEVESLILKQARAVARREVQSHAQGDRQRDWRFNETWEKTEYAPGLLPLCAATFKYGETLYRFWASGENIALNLNDPLPKDKSRRRRIRLGCVPALLCAVAFSACYILLAREPHLYSMVVVPTVAALVFAALRRSSILKYSRRVREATLARRQIEDLSNADNYEAKDLDALEKKAQKPSLPALANHAYDALFVSLSSLVLVGLVVLAFFILRL
ncbi:MAG: hypothetical protein LBO66_08555 [Deltaproteobacteria bacterium]|jgi:hypothetical protein|nr:hypothetical protein [Deltaproteobacteria bacterium]